jgi:hypothetical protein
MAIFPQAPGGYFRPSPGARIIYKKPLEPHKGPLPLTWAGPLPQQ